jgi:hypothetical protein
MEETTWKPRPRREGNTEMDLHGAGGLGLDLFGLGFEAISGSF